MAGSLAFADPAAEWCVLAILLGAEVTVASAQGRREVRAHDLLRDAFSNSLRPDEMLLEIRWPSLPRGRSIIIEQSHTRGDFAVVIAAAYVAGDSHSRDIRVAVGGASPTPVRLGPLEGVVAESGVPELQETRALIEDMLDPPQDIYGSRDYRIQLAAALARRALSEAMA